MLEKQREIRSDEELVLLARQGDELAEELLIRSYKDTIRAIAHLYHMAGADRDDIMQEGMIGLIKAIRGYDAAKNASFRTFSELCINRQILSAIRGAGRKKHAPLNTSLSLSNPLTGEREPFTLEETLAMGEESDPAAQLILKEFMDFLDGRGEKILSDLETEVWMHYMHGKGYAEIATTIGRTPKSVDNAIQRIKHKLAVYFAG